MDGIKNSESLAPHLTSFQILRLVRANAGPQDEATPYDLLRVVSSMPTLAQVGFDMTRNWSMDTPESVLHFLRRAQAGLHEVDFHAFTTEPAVHAPVEVAALTEGSKAVVIKLIAALM